MPDHTFSAVLHVSLQVTHQAELHTGWEPGEQLPDWLLVAVSRHSALPVLRLLRGASKAPLLRTPLLQPLLWPDRQPGLWRHRGPVWLSLPHVQIHPPAWGPRTIVLRLLEWVLQHPAAAHGDGTRQWVGIELQPFCWSLYLWASLTCHALSPPSWWHVDMDHLRLLYLFGLLCLALMDSNKGTHDHNIL